MLDENPSGPPISLPSLHTYFFSARQHNSSLLSVHADGTRACAGPAGSIAAEKTDNIDNAMVNGLEEMHNYNERNNWNKM